MSVAQNIMEDLYPSRREADPAFLPRLDPVVHGAWRPDAPIAAAEADQFERNGFLVMENLFSSDEVSLLQAETARLLADPTGLDPGTAITEPGGTEIRSIFKIHAQSDVMARLATDMRLVDTARFLLGDEVYVHQSRLNYKPGFLGKEFYWHSDFETWHVEDGMPRMRALSMSILLARNTAHNGPLMLIPGSHRKFLTCVGETPDDHYLQSLKKQEYGVPDEVSLAEMAADHGIVSAVGEPGSVIIFDCNLMHGSNGNITPFPRSNAFIVYNAVSNRLQAPFSGKAPRPPFIAERNPQPIRPIRGLQAEAAA